MVMIIDVWYVTSSTSLITQSIVQDYYGNKVIEYWMDKRVRRHKHTPSLVCGENMKDIDQNSSCHIPYLNGTALYACIRSASTYAIQFVKLLIYIVWYIPFQLEFSVLHSDQVDIQACRRVTLGYVDPGWLSVCGPTTCDVNINVYISRRNKT